MYRKDAIVVGEWIRNSNKALLVTGARQTGKTWLIRDEIEKSGYTKFELNFIDQPDMVSYLNAEMSAEEFLIKLKMIMPEDCKVHETVVFFDEIQKCPEIVTKIKFLVDEGSFKYVMSGSLLGVELKGIASAPVGYLTVLRMYPMDFEEFMVANNVSTTTLDMLEDKFKTVSPIEEFIHQKLLAMFFVYLIVGGMPDAVKTYIEEHAGQCGIVYCLTRKLVEEVTEKLMKDGFSVTRYHAGLSDSERKQNQEDFIFDRAQIMVATNAFGMGIDKPNVRFVIHYNMPKDLESYYQEAGRAGRDGEPARCTLLYSGTDVRTIRFFIDKEMEADNGLPADVKAEAARKAEERLKYMTFYSTTPRCLRGYLLSYFGEAAPQKCENCSNCLLAAQAAEQVEEQAAQARQRAAASAKRLASASRRRADEDALSEADEKLLAALYALRKRLAAKQKLPAYMVFNDSTLRQMALKKPLSVEELLNIPGVGEKKAARYGQEFLSVIEDMVSSR